MDDILAKAQEYRKLVATRALAHEKSAEWHRHVGAKPGGIATALSALVGTTIFATITSQFGLDGQGHISLPSGGEQLGAFSTEIRVKSVPPHGQYEEAAQIMVSL